MALGANDRQSERVDRSVGTVWEINGYGYFQSISHPDEIELGYEHDASGRINSHSTGRNHQELRPTQKYTFDPLSQLTDVSRSDNQNEKYRSDANGNPNEQRGFQTKDPDLIHSDGIYLYCQHSY